MNLQEKTSEAWKRWSPELLIFALLLGFGFWINRGVELKGLYMDDLYLWSCYGDQSFTEYVFPMGSSRFRFLFYLASWLELFFIGGHVEWMVPFNIILNAGIAYSIYRMAVSFSDGRKILSFAAGILYLSSRMAYYQIGQFYGLMESLALWAALGMLWFLYRYVNEKKAGAFLAANVLYFVVSFIHERYMVLLPLLLLTVLWMSIYNVTLHMGALNLTTIREAWIGFPIAYVFAMCMDWFVVSGPAKGFAFRFLVKPESPVLHKVIAVSCSMVVPMVIIMSMYGALEGCVKSGNFNLLLIIWLTNIPKNFIMALPFQLLVAGPLVRRVFRGAFPEGTVLA